MGVEAGVIAFDRATRKKVPGGFAILAENIYVKEGLERSAGLQPTDVRGK
jgi:hypothetical protein